MKKKLFQKARNIFQKLKTDPSSVLFSEEKIGNRLWKKLKKSKHEQDLLLLKLTGLVDGKTDRDDKKPARADYVEKREVDRSALYSFDGPLQLVHMDVGNLEILGKSATTPRNVLVAVDLYSFKIYVYPMRSRKQIF